MISDSRCPWTSWPYERCPCRRCEALRSMIDRRTPQATESKEGK
jgi:hypothetical protein